MNLGSSIFASLVMLASCGKSARDPSPTPTPVAPRVEPTVAVVEAKAPVGDRKLVAVPPAVSSTVALVEFATGLDRPVAAVAAAGDPARRLFLAEQHAGRLRLFLDGKLVAAPLLDLGGKISKGNEQGLLGIALHPDFLKNGRLFLNYTARDDSTHIVEYRFDLKANTVDAKPVREVWSIAQPFSNHNGGHLQFGPDGKLYTGTGDGGSGGDPLGAGQDLNNLLGKILRFNVDGTSVAAPELVHIGARNPWRFDFDPAGGALYIGDVGQNAWENVYVVAGDDTRQHNFGWNVSEGAHCYNATPCDQSLFTAPSVDYSHQEGCSITGGVVYRGAAISQLAGAYFYADYCTGLLRSFRWQPGLNLRDGGVVTDHWDWQVALDPSKAIGEVSSFARDSDGEMLMLSLRGTIWRLSPR